MKRRKKTVLLIAGFGIFFVFFFFAPVVFWMNVNGGTIANRTPIFAVYRSPSCVALGVGITYAHNVPTTAGDIWYLSCEPRVPVFA